MIEFALLLPVLFLMIIGAIDFGTFIHQKMQLQTAARAGVQFAVQSDTTIDDADGIALAAASATDVDFTSVTTTTTQFCACSDGVESAVDTFGDCVGTCTGGELPGLYVRVNLTGDFTPLFPIRGISSLASGSTSSGVTDLLTIVGQASLRVE